MLIFVNIIFLLIQEFDIFTNINVSCPKWFSEQSVLDSFISFILNFFLITSTFYQKYMYMYFIKMNFFFINFVLDPCTLRCMVIGFCSFLDNIYMYGGTTLKRILQCIIKTDDCSVFCCNVPEK